MTEREMIESMRDKFREAEALITSGLKDGDAVVRLCCEAGNAHLANEAFTANAILGEGLKGFQRAHGEATRILLTNWPDFYSEVVLQGPGR